MHLFKVPAGTVVGVMPRGEWKREAMVKVRSEKEAIFDREQLIADPVAAANGNLNPEITAEMAAAAREGFAIFETEDIDRTPYLIVVAYRRVVVL